MRQVSGAPAGLLLGGGRPDGVHAPQCVGHDGAAQGRGAAPTVLVRGEHDAGELLGELLAAHRAILPGVGADGQDGGMRMHDALGRWWAELPLRWRRGGREGVFWALRLTAAAVASYVVASALFPGTRPLLAPLTALLVVQVTPVSLLASGLDRVVSVVAGVSLAVGFSTVVPLAWWSLGLLIAVSLLLGQALRLRSNLIEVAISAMLVLGVGSLGAEAAGWQRITVTLVGAAVGVVANLLFPPRVATADAGKAIDDLADSLSRLLTRAADELAQAAPDGAEVAARARGWLDDARTITYDIPNVGAALLRAEQGRRLNVRAVGTPDAGPGLRQGLEALEHSAVSLRGMFRAVHDATADDRWPHDEAGEALLEGLGEVFRELSDGVDAFGELVRAESRAQQRSVTPEIHHVQAALDGLDEARARLEHLLLVDTDPVLFELCAALLGTVRRLQQELSLDARVRRQLRLLTRPRGRVPRPPVRVASRRPRPPHPPPPDRGPDQPTQLM